MGIKITGKTKNPGALKLSSKISSYLFEEEYGELKNKDSVKEALKNALKALSSLTSN